MSTGGINVVWVQMHSAARPRGGLEKGAEVVKSLHHQPDASAGGLVGKRLRCG